jgi:hypothetical protein
MVESARQVVEFSSALAMQNIEIGSDCSIDVCSHVGRGSSHRNKVTARSAYVDSE